MISPANQVFAKVCEESVQIPLWMYLKRKGLYFLLFFSSHGKRHREYLFVDKFEAVIESCVTQNAEFNLEPEVTL